jgi:hypothetical protein
MKTRRGWRYSSTILDLGTRWRRVFEEEQMLFFGRVSITERRDVQDRYLSDKGINS